MRNHVQDCVSSAAARRLVAGAALLALAALVPLDAYAQTAALEGQVTDAQGGAVAGATVTATTPGRAALAATTDGGGMFRFTALDPGTYSLTVALAGFRTERRAALAVAAGETLRIDVQLGLAPFAQQVDVIGVGPGSGQHRRPRQGAGDGGGRHGGGDRGSPGRVAGRCAQRAARLRHAGGRHRQPVSADAAVSRLHRLAAPGVAAGAWPCTRTARGSTSPSATRCSST